MSLMVCLVLAYGPLNWSFPWWLWVLAVMYDGGGSVIRVRGGGQQK